MKLNVLCWIIVLLGCLALPAFAIDPAFATDRGEITSGETRTAIEPVGPLYMDRWSFNGTAGDRVLITAVKTLGDMDTNIRLYPPDGSAAILATYNDSNELALPQTGLYTLIIEDYNNDHAGIYNLTLLNLSGTLTSPADADGGPLVSGQTLSGTIAASDLDAFQFYGSVGERAFIITKATSGAWPFDTQIRLYPPRWERGHTCHLQ